MNIQNHSGMNRTTDPEAARLGEVFGYYKNQNISANQDLLVEMLREIQDIYGFLPTDLLPEIAETAGRKETVIRKLIKLYPSLKFAEYDHRICVCSGAVCSREGAGELLDAFREGARQYAPVRFKITAGGCMKHCSTAPNCMVDEKLYTNVRPNDIPGILKECICSVKQPPNMV